MEYMKSGRSNSSESVFIRVRLTYICRYWCEFEGRYYIDVMDWFTHKVLNYNIVFLLALADQFQGDDIFESQPITHEYCEHKPTNNGTFESITSRVYEIDLPMGSEAPLYFN